MSIESSTERLSVLEAKFDMLSKKVDDIYVYDTKLYRDMRVYFSAFFLGMATVAVLAGATSYVLNSGQIKDAAKDASDRVDNAVKSINDKNDTIVKSNETRLGDAISRIDDKLRQVENRNVVSSYSISSVSGRPGKIRVTPIISRPNVSNQNAYSLTIQFEALIEARGKGVGRLLGMSRRYSGDVPFIMSNNPNGDFYDTLINGNAYYFTTPANIVEGYPFHDYWEISTINKSCKDVNETIARLKKSDNLGAVFLKAMFEQVQENPAPQKLEFELTIVSSVFQCDDFK